MVRCKSVIAVLLAYFTMAYIASMWVPTSYATPAGFYVHVKEEPDGARIQFSRDPVNEGWTDVNPCTSWQCWDGEPVFVRNIGTKSGMVEEGRDHDEDGTIDMYSNPSRLEPGSQVRYEPGKLQVLVGKIITGIYFVGDLIGNIFKIGAGKPAYADVYIADGSYVMLETSVSGELKFTLLSYSGIFTVRVYSAKDPTSRYLDEIGEYVRYSSDEYFLEQGIVGVGGIVVPVDKFGLLAPYIGFASTIIVATAATAVYVKRVKRRKEKQ